MAFFLGSFITALVVAAGAPTGSPPEFPPLRHGVKAVFGQDGNDHGGDFEGRIPGLVRGFHDLGVDLTRIEFKWAIIEPTRGVYDWSEPDRLIAYLHDNGIEPMLMMYCAPIWAMRGRPEDEELFIARGEQNLHTVVWPERKFLEDFERFCEAAARRYAGRANLFEFWNEPDGMAGPIVLHDRDGKAVDVRYGGDAAEYTYWLKRMYAAVKRGNPDAQVAAGSLCVHDLKFIEGIYAAGGREACDAISLHPYADKGINVGWVRDVREVMCRNGDWAKPVWLSEFGWTSKGQYDEKTGGFDPSADEHARIIRETFPQIIALPYITHSFFFTLNDWGTSAGGIDRIGIHTFGIMDYGLHRRPGFEAFKEVVAGTPKAARKADHAPRRTFAPLARTVDCTSNGFVSFSTQVYDPAGVVRSRRSQVEVSIPGLLKESLLRAGSLRPKHVADDAAVRVAEVSIGVNVSAGSPGVYPVTLQIENGSTADGLVSVPADAARVKEPPQIDGVLGEWGERLNITAGKLRAGFAWDDQYLYFAARVEDKEHQQPHQGRDLWKGDCIQLGIDSKRDAVRGSKYDDNDSELALALAGGKPAMWRYACPPGGYVGEVEGAKLAVRREGEVTVYEMALAWKEIDDTAPGAGRIIGLCIAACDWTGEERVVHRFGDGVIGGKEPYRFGGMRLVGEGRSEQ